MKCENFSCWKDCIELALKVIFVAVFTYGVMCAVCCIKSCNSSGSACCKSGQVAPVKQCGANCQKPCCSK